MTEEERQAFCDAIDTVLEMMRIHPPHRIGEAAFQRRLFLLKQQIRSGSSGKRNGK